MINKYKSRQSLNLLSNIYEYIGNTISTLIYIAKLMHNMTYKRINLLNPCDDLWKSTQIFLLMVKLSFNLYD